MSTADAWYVCRAGYVETARAAARTAGRTALAEFRAEWPSFDVIELDQALAEAAVELAKASELRSLDAIHLASALLLPREDLVFATWDRRQWKAAAAERLSVVPEQLP
jgi:predicted nucleic acid-binding protein